MHFSLGCNNVQKVFKVIIYCACQKLHETVQIGKIRPITNFLDVTKVVRFVHTQIAKIGSIFSLGDFSKFQLENE